MMVLYTSTVDRSIRATAVLGNKEEFDGELLSQPNNFSSTLLPLFYSSTINPFCDFDKPIYGFKGKVVLCDGGSYTDSNLKGQLVYTAGGVAMIVTNEKKDSFTKRSFLASNRRTIIGRNSAPIVGSFSSRGPSLASPGILKPDIIGPGVNILAAWPSSVENNKNSKLTFNVISGTSMSCPHLSGIAALFKSVHPHWSPAAIKSAIMTTADLTNLAGKPIVDERLLPADIFATGSVHVNPSRAINPGLVYDLEPNDYIPYLCGLNYTDQDIYFITKQKVKCSKVSKIPEAQLNYPSFSITLGSGDDQGYTRTTYMRTVTNVGEANSSYDSVIVALLGVNVTLNTTRLEFSKVNQKMTYQVTFSWVATNEYASFIHGFLMWKSSNSMQFVRTPIFVKLV
ncbi:Subtilisin-like protease SBT1.2 [Camellia lanceoleosa]|uniref:Subtilisin-like protease SBT1.2 n=1 Tax=Camellia lanceoleosa TaxID=1840588 RepID=A0ACC0G0L6_9ERIC|nr:Subtilisin-like protease SBT1.2 [Camellia lanceoleosa]